MSQFGRPIISKAGTPRMGVESAKLRTMYMKVKPAPSTLSERRAVLQMLKQHGDIHMFQKMIDASSFVSLAATQVIAERIVARSPLSFRYNPSASSTSSPDANSEPAKTFLVHVFHTEKYAHKTRIRDSPLHGRWDIDPYNVWQPHTLSTNALPQVVPPGMGHRGLSDWESCGQLQNPEDKQMLTVKEEVAIREKRQQELASMESLVEIWKENTAEGRKAAEELEKKGFGTTSWKTKARAFEVLEKAVADEGKRKDYGDASF